MLRRSPYWRSPRSTGRSPKRPLVTPKAPEVASDVVSIDFYFNIIEYAPPDSVFWKEKPFVPIVPYDEPPPVWQYEYPELTFDRLSQEGLAARVVRPAPDRPCLRSSWKCSLVRPLEYVLALRGLPP